jgi:glutamyl-tRNA synthetase
MGWDHHSAISTASADPEGDEALPDLTRADSHSYYDLFTVPQLVSAFSLEHVNTKKAAVNLSKLDFINKLTLRRKAGRLGADGVMVDLGKERFVGQEGGGQDEYDELVDRVQEMLRGQRVLQGK